MIQPRSPLSADVTAAPQISNTGVSDSTDLSSKRVRLPKNRTNHDRANLPSHLLQRALEIFYNRHHSIEFCSFLHVPSLEIDVLCRQSPFFVHALISLTALYLSEEEAAKEGFLTPATLSEWHAVMAREYSRQSVDLPSSKHGSSNTVDICSLKLTYSNLVRTVQANLMLALRELLTRTSHKAWIFTGIAIRQAQVLRLGREYHSRVSNRQREVQRRTYWACFLMDRLVSYGCWRPQMIDLECISINLPCPENAFAFEEPFDGPRLNTLPFPCAGTSLGVAPYFIAALELWAQATYVQIKGGRRWNDHHPSSSASSFSRLGARLDEFINSIPRFMQWSTQNRKAFRHTNQEGLFINLHLLLLDARCVMNQEYLLYPDGTGSAPAHHSPFDTFDGAELPPEGRRETIVASCVYSSETIVTIMNELWHAQDTGTRYLQSVFAATAMLSAANIQLWLQYVGSKDDQAFQCAMTRVGEVAAVFESWKAQWPVANAWLNTLVSLQRLYEAAYSPRLSSDDSQQGDNDLTAPPKIVDDAQDRPVARLTEGNGLPEFEERMVDKIRFTLLSSLEDLDARERVLKASMNTTQHHIAASDDHADGFEYRVPEDYEFGLPELYLDDAWPGLG